MSCIIGKEPFIAYTNSKCSAARSRKRRTAGKHQRKTYGPAKGPGMHIEILILIESPKSLFLAMQLIQNNNGHHFKHHHRTYILDICQNLISETILTISQNTCFLYNFCLTVTICGKLSCRTNYHDNEFCSCIECRYKGE